MRRKSLVWKLFPIHFLIALLSVAVVSILAINAFGEFYYSQVERDLKVRARLVARELAEDSGLRADTDRLESFAKSLDECCGTRVTVIAPDGTVVADSEKNPERMENHADRPEFKGALAGEVGTSRRKSPTLGVTMIYAAVPVEVDGRVVMVLRTSLAASAVDAAPSITYARFAAGALLIAVLAGIASLLAARHISEPIQRMREAAQRFAGGDLQARVAVPDTEELASLAETLNSAASQLAQQLRTISQQAREQQAIMSSMREGVIAVDTDDRLILLNPAAEQLLDVEFDAVKGRVIQEAIRNPGLQQLFEKLHDAGEPLSQEIVFRGREDRIVQAVGAPLVDAEEGAPERRGDRRAGVVVVLNDITQTRKLENVRKDFVANVSHELKTPITAIKGYIEVLRQGTTAKSKEDAKFLGIVARQADRLNAIIDDLLALSKIEQSAEAREIDLAISPICPVFEAARTNCLTKAAEVDIEIESECDEHLSARINAPLLEQAITNLLDNAVKYSPRGSTVTMRAEVEGGEIALSVIDQGQGIEPEHLSRIFERFYRVDKARSRQKGGTGLGLAIVKHIVQAHGGRVTVESTPGKGSTFTIFIPAL
jgi:two-component system, OmpR family, phosphate regulon sensor histidine kinase PhoR